MFLPSPTPPEPSGVTYLDIMAPIYVGIGEQDVGEVSYLPDDADISSLTITSSDSGILSIVQDADSKAYFTYEGISEGTATITATCGDVTTTTSVEVTSEVKELYIPIEEILIVGEEGECSVDYIPSNVDISTMTITSSDSSVLSVTQDVDLKSLFTFNALAEGTAEVTATCGDVTTSVSVEVTAE